MWRQSRGRRPAPRGGLAWCRRHGIRHRARRVLLLLLLLRVEKRRVRSCERRRGRRLLPLPLLGLVLLIIVPRAVAVVLLLLTNVGLLRCLCRLPSLARSLGVRIGVVWICAWRVRVSTSVLVTAIIRVSEIRVGGLGCGLAGGSRRSSARYSRRRQGG